MVNTIVFLLYLILLVFGSLVFMYFELEEENRICAEYKVSLPSSIKKTTVFLGANGLSGSERGALTVLRGK